MRFSIHLLCFAFCLRLAEAGAATMSGAEIYAKHCAECHGENGEGVADEFEDPLHGTRSLPSLTRYIDRNMPEEDPDLLDAEESRRVADYIMGAFYSAEARVRNEPPQKMAFARMTNRQYWESVADLIGSFGKITPPGQGRGLKGRYFESEGMNKNAKFGFEREDGKIDFDFGENSPGEGIGVEQFSIAWEGSLLAPVTGWYEFRVTTPNGARLYLNGDHEVVDPAKPQLAVIDAWVSSGNDVREVAGRIFLLGGRAYPLRLDYFKYQERLGKMRLDWKQPRGEWEVLAAPYLSPEWAAHVAVTSTAFPPDDASEGYERGTGVSKAWHEATTTAAIEVANQVVARLPQVSGAREDDPARAVKLKEFVAEFASRAFRRPLDDGLRGRFVDAVFASGIAPEQAVKRAVILILQSPRFLYPEIGPVRDEFTVAARLALGVWDSLPDGELLTEAREGRLRTREQVAAQARRLMADSRAKAKVAGFFGQWLKLDVEADLQKDAKIFPGFDAALVVDLRRSLEMFVEQVVWSEASDYRELIQSDYWFVNERLAKFYGLRVPEGGGFAKVVLDPQQRSGVVTHPYLLARLSHHNDTSPIHRGVFVTRNLLGGFLRPPPQAIAFKDHDMDPNLSMREKVAHLTRDTSCMTCHETINPLGFSLENYDAVGRFRLMEDNKRLIISESDFETFEGGQIRLRGARDLAHQAVESVTARRGFVRQMFQAVVKQNPGVYGPDALNELEKKFSGSDYHLRDLLVEIFTLTALKDIHL